MSAARNKFSPEFRDRAVRMVEEHRGDCLSEWAAMSSIAAKVGCTASGAGRRRPGSGQGAGTQGEGTAPGQRDTA